MAFVGCAVTLNSCDAFLIVLVDDVSGSNTIGEKGSRVPTSTFLLLAEFDSLEIDVVDTGADEDDNTDDEIDEVELVVDPDF